MMTRLSNPVLFETDRGHLLVQSIPVDRWLNSDVVYGEDVGLWSSFCGMQDHPG